MINTARLSQILLKKDNGERLNAIDLQDFNKITRQLKTQDYRSFAQAMRPNYKWAWFHEYLLERVNLATLRKNGRLMCQMPQQHGKSEIFGRLIVPYIFGKFPEWKTMYVTFSDDRAKDVSADILTLIASETYNKLFPNVVLKDSITEEIRTANKRTNKLSIHNFTNVNSLRGEFKAVGIEGSTSGYDANLIILDDFFSGPVEYNSQIIREKRWKIFTENILKRQQKDTIILIMSTHWHEDDIIGRLKKYIEIKDPNAPDWEVIVFNAEKDERDYPYDHRQIGEYLWPEERMDVYLEGRIIDPIGWQTTYQNIPQSSSGVVFDTSCFRYYDEVPSLIGMRVVITVDPNYKKEAKQGDDCAIVVLGFLRDKIYLLDFSSVNKVDILDNVNRIQAFIQKYPDYHAILIEDAAQGEDIVTILRHQHISKIMKFIPQGQSKGGNAKLYRAQTMIPYCRAGQFYVPSPRINGNINFYVNQFMNFTGFDGGKDDCVDATTQAFIEFKYLLEPIKLDRIDYTVKNDFNIGRGLTKISRPFAVGNYEKTKKPTYAQKYFGTSNR